MVRITRPYLFVARAAMNASKELAYVTPTAFSGLSITYGADTCSDSPDPSTMAGSVFIPEHHKFFYPTLTDAASFKAGVDDGAGVTSAKCFFGFIESLSIKDRPGETVPAGFANARNMANLNGWEFSTGTTPGQAPAVATFTPGGSHIEIQAPAVLDTAKKVFVTSPPAPVSPAKRYRITGLFRRAGGQLSGTTMSKAEYLWLDAGGTVIATDSETMGSLSFEEGFEWGLLNTLELTPPAGAVSLRLRAWLNIAALFNDDIPMSAGVDGLTLHEYTDKAPANPERFAGRHVTFTSSDITAQAGRLMVGDTPWPQESGVFRTNRIRALVEPVYRFQLNGIHNDIFAYRDVDNQSSLEVCRRYATSVGAVAVASNVREREITNVKDARYVRIFDVAGAGNAIIRVDPNIPALSAAGIEDAPLTTSITGLSNQVQFGYRAPVPGGSEEASQTVKNATSIAKYGPMTRTIDTDLAAPTGTAWDQARAVVTAQAAPSWELEGNVQLVIKDDTIIRNVSKILEAQSGFRSLVMIDGAPELLGQYQRIKSATLTFGKKLGISLGLEPDSLISPQPVTFGDVQTSYYTGLTLGECKNVTIGQLATASRNFTI